jgi:hypothetical protein
MTLIDGLGLVDPRRCADKDFFDGGTALTELRLLHRPAVGEEEVDLHSHVEVCHYSEQVVGAPLAVMGGVLAVRGDGLRPRRAMRDPDPAADPGDARSAVPPGPPVWSMGVEAEALGVAILGPTGLASTDVVHAWLNDPRGSLGG